MDKSTSKKRITYLDMVKGIGICTMIVVHTFGSFVVSDNKPYFAFFICFFGVFTMAMFLVVSGMLMPITRAETKPLKENFKKKLRTLIIPYFVFSAIYLGIDFFMQPGAFSPQFYLESFISTVTFAGVSVLWYMPALFVSEMLFLYGAGGSQKRKIIFSCSFVVVGLLAMFFSDVCRISLWNENMFLFILGRLVTVVMRSAVCVMFLTIGYWAGVLLKGREKFSILELLAGVAALTLCGLFCMSNGVIDMNTMFFGNMWLYLLYALLGAFGIILICKNIPNIPPINWIGKNSLIIMLTHQDFLILLHAKTFSYWVNQFTVKGKDLILFLVLFAFMAGCEIITVRIFDKAFPFLIGKQDPQKKS
ncbi:MAG: acyltransferase [Lachnospiraceae bacterium]|nr:acyltransferase [Candidatus Merdinaster equi]